MQTDLPLRYVLSVPSRRPASDEMPLVVMMHGRGADANDLSDLAPYIDGPTGYRFLFPNAPRAWEAAPGMTFGFTWFDGIPPEPKSFEVSRDLVMRFVGEAVKKFPTVAGKVVIGGFSQGAAMALDVGLRRDDVAGIVAMSGALFETAESEFKPHPVLIVHGTVDDMINVNLARRARRVLEERGLEPEYHEFVMGHQVTEESITVIRDFIGRCLE